MSGLVMTMRPPCRGRHPNGGWCISVEGVDGNVQFTAQNDVVQSGLLILAQGFCRKQVKGSGRGIFQKRLENREIVAEGFARGRRCNDDRVFSRTGALPAGGLMRIERGDALFFQGGGKFPDEAPWVAARKFLPSRESRSIR